RRDARPVLPQQGRVRRALAQCRGAPAPRFHSWRTPTLPSPARGGGKRGGQGNRAVSIGLAAALLGLSALALAMLLAPLFYRRRGPASRDAYSLAVYRDQLAEIERDLARGVLAAEHAEAARAEIARRIL